MEEILSSLNAYDFIAIFVIISIAVNGFRRGFIQEVSGVITLLVSLGLSKIFSMPVAQKMYDILDMQQKIVTKLTEGIEQVYAKRITSGPLSVTDALTEQNAENLRVMLGQVTEKFGFVGKFISDGLNKDFDIYTILKSGGDTFVSDLAEKLLYYIEPVVLYVMNMVVFIVMFIVISLLLKIVSGVLSSLFQSLPLVSTTDSLLGLGVGTLKGIVLIIVVYSALFLLLSLIGGVKYVTLDDLIASKTFSLISDFKYLIK